MHLVLLVQLMQLFLLVGFYQKNYPLHFFSFFQPKYVNASTLRADSEGSSSHQGGGSSFQQPACTRRLAASGGRQRKRHLFANINVL